MKTILGFNPGIMAGRLMFFLAIYYGSSTTIAFAQNEVIEEIPFIINNNHLIIKIRLNESEPLNFIFDSGAGATLISKKTADSIGFESGAKRKNVGVSGEHNVELIKGVDLSYGDRLLGNINALSTETYFEELDNGEEVDGVIGYAILLRFVTEIDRNKKVLVLYNKSTYEYSGGGTGLPIYLVQNLPIADAQAFFQNEIIVDGQFLIDTGARSEVIMSSPTVIEYNLANNIGEHYNLRASIGTSTRRTKMRYGRLDSLKFAGFEFDNVPVALSSDNKGVLSMGFIDGIIGNKLLERFNVVFDYPREMLYLMPGELYKKDYKINVTGFNLSFIDAKPIIKNLVDRSPADKAGLRNGDEIISINGVIVENLSSDEIRESFSNEGETITLVIKRHNKLKYTEFKPRPLI